MGPEPLDGRRGPAGRSVPAAARVDPGDEEGKNGVFGDHLDEFDGGEFPSRRRVELLSLGDAVIVRRIRWDVLAVFCLDGLEIKRGDL